MYSKICQVHFLLCSKRTFNVVRSNVHAVSIQKTKLNILMIIYSASMAKTVHFHLMIYPILELPEPR